MANQSYLFPEDDEELSQIGLDPYSSISNSTTTANPVVKDFISSKSRPISAPVDFENDPYMKQYRDEQKGLDDYRQAKLGGDFITNIGQSLNNLSLGANAPKDNAPLFKSMNEQGQEALKSRESDLDRSRKVMEAIESRKFRENSINSQREQTNALRSLARADKMEKEAQKKEERDLALAVPGFERTGEVLPKAEEAVKLRGALASAEQLKSKLKRMKELVNKYGSYEYGGEGGTEMESLATEIQLLSKNKDMYDLGVLTGPDMSLLQKITADPASLRSMFTFNNTRQKQIDTQLGSIEDKLNTTAKSMGYRRPGMSVETEKAMSPMSSDQFPKQVRKNGQVATVSNASEYAEAQQDGWN